MGLTVDDLFNASIAYKALIKGLCGAALFWFITFIIGDIALKSILEDVPKDKLEELEGGLIQRMHATKNMLAVQDISLRPAESAQNLDEKETKKKKKKKNK